VNKVETLTVPINTDEYRQLQSGVTGSIAKICSKHWDSKIEKGKEFQFEEITAVCSLGEIQMQPRVYWSTRDYPAGRKPVIVFRVKRGRASGQ